MQWLGLASALFPEQFLVSELLEDLEHSEQKLQGGPDIGEDWRWQLLSMQPASDDVVPADPHVVSATGVPSDPGYVNFVGSRIVCSLEYITIAIETALSNPLPVLHILRSLSDPLRLDSLKTESTLHGEWELERVVIRKLVPLLLQPSCARCLQDEFCSWWHSLPFSALEPLVPVVVEAMRDDTELAGVSIVGSMALEFDPKRGRKKCHPVTYSQLVQEPLTLLACSLKLYRTPLLTVTLSVLQQILTKNRRICQACVSEGKSLQNVGSELSLRREEVTAALAAQDRYATGVVGFVAQG